MRCIKIRLSVIIVLTGLALASITVDLAADSDLRIKIGYLQRLRIETTDNATHLDRDAQAGSSYFRNRISLMFQVYPIANLELATKLTDEMRYWMVPETRLSTFDEIFFDLLYLKWDNIGQYPLSLTLGRQDIMFGEGFVVMDGGPLDGSRSAYFNALRVDWSISNRHLLTAVYTTLPEKDKYLPIINDQDKKMVEQPEQAAIAYYAGMIDDINLQGYFIYKQIDSTAERPQSADIYCPGLRIQAPIVERLILTAEAALQFGEMGEADQQAFGGYAYAEYKTGWPIRFPKTFTLGGLYLSGDDLGTEDYEGWEPLFGRWPKWSESFIYTLTREHAVAYWTNLASLFAGTLVEIIPDLTLSFTYHHLMAPEKDDPETSFPGSGGGRDRGDLFISRLSYKMNKHLSGHIHWETFRPGDFYFGGADNSAWVRMEVMLAF